MGIEYIDQRWALAVGRGDNIGMTWRIWRRYESKSAARQNKFFKKLAKIFVPLELR